MPGAALRKAPTRNAKIAPRGVIEFRTSCDYTVHDCFPFGLVAAETASEQFQLPHLAMPYTRRYHGVRTTHQQDSLPFRCPLDSGPRKLLCCFYGIDRLTPGPEPSVCCKTLTELGMTLHRVAIFGICLRARCIPPGSLLTTPAATFIRGSHKK